MIFPVVGRVLGCAMLLLFTLGCFQMTGSSLDEEKDPHFIEGKKRVNSMDYEGAIEAFERALQANPKSAAAHLELGILYDQRKNDPGSAIYHYQRHLQLRKDSPMADVVNQNITACKRELAKTVSVALVSREVQRDLERLTQTNAAMRERMQALEAELRRRPQFITNIVTNWLTVTQVVTRTIQVPAETPSPAEVTQREPTPAPQNVRETRPTQSQQRSTATQPTVVRETPTASRTYTVRPGDTLMKISRQHNVSIRDITRANPRVNPHRIIPGQVLVIPPRQP